MRLKTQKRLSFTFEVCKNICRKLSKKTAARSVKHHLTNTSTNTDLDQILLPGQPNNLMPVKFNNEIRNMINYK